MTRIVVAPVVFLLCLHLSTLAHADLIVDFGVGTTFVNAPYSEDGLTLTANSGSTNWTVGPWTPNIGNNRSLQAGTNSLASLRVASTIGPIDLFSIDVINSIIFQSSFSITSSNGAVLTVPNSSSLNTLAFTGAGWTGISHFDIIGSGANANIRLDNIRFDVTSVPEPSSMFLVTLVCFAARSFTRRR